MLKNVAIPLMLAATEAEAQDWLREALEADEGAGVAGFAADAAACTPASDDALAGLAQATKEAQGLVDKAQEDMDALKAAGTGAWALAVAARDAAVADAAAQEAASAVAEKLDALDAAYAAERAKARDAADAAAALAAGERRKVAAGTRNGDAEDEEVRLKGLRDAATAAVDTAKAQHAKELLWQEWLYCELGAVPAGLSTYSSWWKAILSDNTISSQNTAPNFCTVPAVDSDLDSAGNPVKDADGVTLQDNGVDRVAVVLRPAVQFYSDKTNLGAEVEPTDGTAWKKWTATLTLDMAKCQVNWIASCALLPQVTQASVQTNIASNEYTREGAVAYRTGDFRAKTWVKNQRSYEAAYYTAVNVSRVAAKSVANSMATDNTYAASGGSGTTYGVADGDGALKKEGAAASARDGYTTLAEVTSGGSAYAGAYRLAGARTAGSNADAWKMDFTITAASIEKWWDLNDAGNSGVAGPVWSWWDKAKDVSEAASAWHTKWAADNAEMALNGFVTDTIVTATNGQNVACDVSATGAGNGPNGGTWTFQTDPTSRTACKTLCEQYNIDNLLVNKDTANPTIDNGGKTMAKYESAGTFCGAASYDADNGTAGEKCQLLIGGHTAVAADDVDQANDICINFTEMAGAGNWSVLQTAVKTAWDALITGSFALHTAMIAKTDLQAGLEKDYLNAWLLTQYWIEVNTQLDTGTSGSLSEDLNTKSTTIALTNDDTNVLTTLGATTIANTADTAQSTATTTLAGYEASVATAQAAVDEFGSRLTRAAAELLELKTLVKVDPNAGTAGELDDVVTERTRVYDAYTKADAPKGEHTLAAAEKAAADAAVAPRSGTETVAGTPDKDGGALFEADAAAKLAWTSATGDVGDANQALTDALAGADLVALRAAVEAKTADWTTANGDLDDAIADLAGKQGDLEAAQKAQAAAVLDCQLKAYDTYRSALEDELLARAADLKTIKALLEKAKADAPAKGAAGARCEKALSNGTFRPARGEATCAEGLCCGAARVWMSAGAGVQNAAWRTVETCQLLDATKYSYQPPRAPMATAMPAKVEVDFACIEGAKQLAAAASALAAAVYMLA